MKDKKYSIDQIQKIIDISPAEIQKLIRKNSQYLNVAREVSGSGKKEVFLDELSFRRLLFISQLEKGGTLNSNAVCELIKTPDLETGVAEAKPVAEYSRLFSAFESMSAEAETLQVQLHALMIKYDHLIKELNITQAKNMSLEKELGTLRNRELALMSHLRQSAENEEEDLDDQLVN
ncbi:MAG: hypothetical protein CVV41_15325 [Candidatus Riflebacteria bacterium HGW-Riflebacteria-1]|jgi:CRISPR/Cas system CMR subunit Cmr4 (Cas7 group RAMP superfamily)|nr:MAG: hypothetical protein CVV41_15325 [Candidatus Riflebacteria bacterium HGW-Riflebacteria-1]